MFENADELLIVADVPGVPNDGIDLRVENDTLTLVARRPARRGGDPPALVREYDEVDFVATFRIPAGIDAGGHRGRDEERHARRPPAQGRRRQGAQDRRALHAAATDAARYATLAGAHRPRLPRGAHAGRRHGASSSGTCRPSDAAELRARVRAALARVAVPPLLRRPDAALGRGAALPHRGGRPRPRGHRAPPASRPTSRREQGLGVARFVRLHDEPTVAEAAVTVVDDVQRKGLGRLLATTLAEAARERGVHTFRADVLADNEPMRAIMAEIGAVERGTSAGVITYDVALDVVGPTRGGPLDRFLRAAASSMAVLLRRLGPPEEG